MRGRARRPRAPPDGCGPAAARRPGLCRQVGRPAVRQPALELRGRELRVELHGEGPADARTPAARAASGRARGRAAGAVQRSWCQENQGPAGTSGGSSVSTVASRSRARAPARPTLPAPRRAAARRSRSRARGRRPRARCAASPARPRPSAEMRSTSRTRARPSGRSRRTGSGSGKSTSTPGSSKARRGHDSELLDVVAALRRTPRPRARAARRGPAGRRAVSTLRLNSPGPSRRPRSRPGGGRRPRRHRRRATANGSRISTQPVVLSPQACWWGRRPRPPCRRAGRSGTSAGTGRSAARAQASTGAISVCQGRVSSRVRRK